MVFADGLPVESDSSVPEAYELIWYDEFDGLHLDRRKWSHRGLGRRRGGIISADASYLDGEGHLVIETRKIGSEYHSGMISTQRSLHVKYGYFETRVKFPAHGGQNSGFWLQSRMNTGTDLAPASSGVEIDIVEFFRGRHGGVVGNTLHWGGYGENHKSMGNRTAFDDCGDWHIFGLHWTENEYTFFVDGRKTWRTSESISRVPQYLILSTVVGTRKDALERAVLPDRFIVDYVRVYKRSGAPTNEVIKP